MTLATRLGRMRMDWQRRSELLRRSVADLAATLLLVAVATITSNLARGPVAACAPGSSPSGQASAVAAPVPAVPDTPAGLGADPRWSACGTEARRALADR